VPDQVSALLSPDEIARITRCTRPSAQCRKLRALGIRFVPAADGAPLVRPEWLDDAGKPAHRSAHRWDRIGNNATVAPLTRARR
jgi:hypothetical protein